MEDHAGICGLGDALTSDLLTHPDEVILMANSPNSKSERSSQTGLLIPVLMKTRRNCANSTMAHLFILVMS